MTCWTVICHNCLIATVSLNTCKLMLVFVRYSVQLSYFFWLLFLIAIDFFSNHQNFHSQNMYALASLLVHLLSCLVSLHLVLNDLFLLLSKTLPTIFSSTIVQRHPGLCKALKDDLIWQSFSWIIPSKQIHKSKQRCTVKQWTECSCFEVLRSLLEHFADLIAISVLYMKSARGEFSDVRGSLILRWVASQSV